MTRLYSFISVICLVSAGCSKPNKVIVERLINADSVAINYFSGNGTMDSVVAVKVIRGSQEVNQLVDLIGARKAPIKTDCGYDGSLHFFKKNQVVQDVYFRMNSDDCSLFTFTSAGQAEATDLTSDAKALLQSFRTR